ncbi:MAG: TRAP transporter substrate-binding protein [Clostridiales bacterium]|nr:TRAP transporter substrate-binding protein [Clostridiales bacterium]
MKRILSIALTLAMALSLTACGGSSNSSSNGGSSDANSKGDGEAAASYQWTAANAQTTNGPWDLALLEFARLLDEKSGGAITLTVYSGGQMGSEKEGIEGVQMGNIDFAICSTASLSSFTDTNAVWDLPYLATNIEEGRKAISSDAAQGLLDSLSNVSIKGLSYWENGIYAIGSTTPIRSMADVQGMRIRAIDSALQADVYSSFGANPVVLAWGDIYTSIQQGVIDAISSTTIVNMHNSNFEEVAPYITTTNHGYSPAPLLMSQTLWDSLPSDIQAIVQEAADEAQAFEFQKMDEALSSCQEAMESAGAEFIDVDLTEWVNAVAPIYDKYVGEGGVDADLVAQLQEAAKA